MIVREEELEVYIPIMKLICGPNVKVRNLWHMN
jgi:hypothetical protein